MSEQMLEVEAQIERLESRLTAAKSDLRRIQERAQTSRGGTPVALVLVAASMLVAAGPLPNKVKAPFQVVDSAGLTIFKVSESDAKKITVTDNKKGSNTQKEIEIKRDRGFTVYDKTGTIALWAEASPTVSSFKAISADGNYQAAMGTVNGGKTPVMGLRFGGPQNTRLAIGVPDGKPSVEMFSDKNVQIVHSEPGDAGGGSLLLNNSKGQPAVLFGVTAKDAGKVVAYPNTLAGGAMAHLYSSMLCGKGGCE